MQKKTKKIIKDIRNARKQNNNNWMKLLEVALTYAPKLSKKILRDINIQDKKISNLVEKLSKNKF
tara:strand:- start:880 stop:1074 length:195 start_codon:yes stop_codon:yes gene_type:complete